jgi:hypothetical protein
MIFSRISPEMALQRKNTHFLVDHFFDKGVSIALGHEVNICLFGFGDLKKSIEIIKSRDYSPYLFQKWLLSIRTDSALEFWGDPYWFKYYEERISTIENLKQTWQNEPYKKDDKLANYCFDADINILQQNLYYLNEAIELSKELRTLINKPEAIPDLEDEFARLLKEHNDLQVNEANTIKEDEKTLPSQTIAKQKPVLSESLELLFESIPKYKKVMEILVSKNLIHSNTYIWKDEVKGNKGSLAALIKDLHGKKYYKNNTRPTNKQIEAICKNSFGWCVGIDTIKHTKATDFNFSFIPPASTLD